MDEDQVVLQLGEQPAMDESYRALLENERQFFRGRGQNLPPLVSLYNQFSVLHVEFENAGAGRTSSGKAFPACLSSRASTGSPTSSSRDSIRCALERHPGVRWMEVGNVTTVPNPGAIGIRADRGSDSGGPPRAANASGPPRGEDILRSGDPRTGGLTGKGAIIVIIDTGIDFRNSDFIEPDRPVSRILYYWDTLIYMNPKFAYGAELPPVSAPNGQPLGIVYTREGLSRDLRERLRTVPLYDIQGHGTCCAGVAAGNGGNAIDNPAAGALPNTTVGAAAGADLIIVRIAWQTNVQYSFLLGAIIDWVESKAKTDPQMKGRPIVYSCSWGSDSGDRAGNQVLERQLNARFPLDRPGRAICLAAGNDGRSAHHGRAFAGGEAWKLTWETRGGEERSGQSMTLYYGGVGGMEDLVVDYVPPESVAGPMREKIRQAVIEDFARTTFRHGILGSLVTDARWSLPMGRHELHITVKRGSGLKVEDAYVMPLSGGEAEFIGASRVYGRQIGYPSGAGNAITVGSYDWSPAKFDKQGRLIEAPMTVGGLSDYSNPGPARIGKTVKPDIVAPGQYWIVSAPDPRQLIGPRGYRDFNGTSAATPYVAGVVALMMQKKPAITPGEIKSLLAAHAGRDPETLIPKDRRDGWGNGKLDAAAVQRILGAIK
ncbi:MAG: S8 family serine peptidase [Kiritimatiellia bacterium]